MHFIPICSQKGIERLAAVADQIWREYWPALIGEDQTSYMVNTLQSVEPLTKDIREKGYLYWFLEDEGEIVGYAGVRPELDTERLFISKIYLFETQRGKGYASKSIAFFESLCQVNGLSSMYLTVNINNQLAIRAYEAKGFTSIKSVETPIGKGYVMDDYIMEKRLTV